MDKKTIKCAYFIWKTNYENNFQLILNNLIIYTCLDNAKA